MIANSGPPGVTGATQSQPTSNPFSSDTLKGQLDLELHGGHTLAGVTARVAQRLLALTAAMWHNRATGQPVTRSLIAYDR
jgi:hypothetical protein